MMLREELRRRLLAKDIHVKEGCNKCGQILGSVRYVRKGEPGAWCSAQCRGDADKPALRNGGRPR